MVSFPLCFKRDIANVTYVYTWDEVRSSARSTFIILAAEMHAHAVWCTETIHGWYRARPIWQSPSGLMVFAVWA